MQLELSLLLQEETKPEAEPRVRGASNVGVGCAALVSAEWEPRNNKTRVFCAAPSPPPARYSDLPGAMPSGAWPRR